MSGPATAVDTEPLTGLAPPAEHVLEISESRRSVVGSFSVRRALPRRERRTVGAWCFADHMGPTAIDQVHGLDVAPHPHIGLQTLTWLLEGEAVHRDSLGTEQVIAPGELNLMTAGHGVAHSEEGTGRYRGQLHGIQLWVAQPSSTRDGPAAFEHHSDLPVRALGSAEVTVLVGELDSARSCVRRDTDHMGADISLRPGTAVLPLRADYEHALVVLTGSTRVDDQIVEPSHLAYLGLGRQELSIAAREPTRAILIGGVPFGESVVMWWNYVARSRDEIVHAHREWRAASERFGTVDSQLPRIEVGTPPWAR